MPLALTAVRTGLKVLPPPLRERAAVKLFMSQTRHAEPVRELAWREKGEGILVAGHHAVRFGDGPPVLLMHGWAGRGLQMCNFIEPLVARGHTVIALDGPNHGRNEGGLGALPTFTAFLEEAIEETGPAAIIAHSMGGSAAIAAAHRSGFTGKLICLGGPPETYEIFTRARDFMQLPESGRDRFMGLLTEMFHDYRMDDIMDIQALARDTPASLYAVLAKDDDDIPVEESQAIIEAGGGQVAIADATHRSVMWEAGAVRAALEFFDA